MANKTKQNGVKRALIGAMAVTIVALSITTYNANKEAQEASEQLTKYQATYDGIDVYEDGSWDYKAGVEPYFFWNWKGEYADAWKVYAETGEDITQENGVQVGAAGR